MVLVGRVAAEPVERRMPSGDEAAAANIELAPEDLAAIDAVLADATPVWGPHPEGMPTEDGGTR